MAKVDKEVLIKAPLGKIFGYIMEPANLLEFWPSLMEIRDIQSLPNGGYSARWVYKMLGMRFEGTAEYTQVVPNRLLVIETKGGITSAIAWTVRSWEDKTRVTLTIEYKVPVPLLGKLAEIIVLKMNDHEADLMMVNLQARFLIANH
jgi:uncharacterized membrane protein